MLRGNSKFDGGRMSPSVQFGLGRHGQWQRREKKKDKDDGGGQNTTMGVVKNNCV